MRWVYALFAAFAVLLAAPPADAQLQAPGGATDPTTGLPICPVSDGAMQHVLRILRAQADIQEDVIRKATLMSEWVCAQSPCPAVTEEGRRMLLDVQTGYVAVLGSGKAWEDGKLNPVEIAADPEASALTQTFKEQIAEQLGVSHEGIDVLNLHAPGVSRRLLAGDHSATQQLGIEYIQRFH